MILCHPNDKSPSDSEFGGNSGALRQTQIDVYRELVARAFGQMSFGRATLAFEFTQWIQLPQDDEFYFDRSTTKAELLVHPLYDAIPAAGAAGFLVNDYEAFVICMATPHIRGWAMSVLKGFIWPTPFLLGGLPTWMASDKHVNVVSVNAHWGRRLHELMHHVGMPDIYGADHVIADANVWDLGGSHNRMPLLSAYNLVPKGWYEQENVVQLQWDGGDFQATYVVRAHGTTEVTADDVVHTIKIAVFDGLTYFVEVRQKPAVIPAELQPTGDELEKLQPAADYVAANPNQVLFDPHIPNVAAPHEGGVIVLKAVSNQAMETLNQRIRRITKLSPKPLQAGDQVVDAARRLTIRVERLVEVRPLSYEITVKWESVATPDPNGLFNLFIRPWDSSWQTPDIWIDSEQNGWDVYEEIDPVTGEPTGNGDKPWVDNENRIYARVHNDGIVDATDVQMTFYINTPPAIGDNGSWVPHAVRTIDSIAAGSSATAMCGWTPPVGKHTCLKVVAMTQTGEVEVSDNGAQENVFRFDTAGASPHQPIVQTVSVQNPLPEPALIHILVRGLEVGWEATVEHEWLWLEARGQRQMRVVLFTDIGRARPLALYPEPEAQRLKIPREVRVTFEGAVYRWNGEGPNEIGEAEHLRPIGGIRFDARARDKVDIGLDLDDKRSGAAKLALIGELTPRLHGVTVHVAITGPEGFREIAHLKTGKDGRFQHVVKSSTQPTATEPYRAQAFVSADPIAADAHSDCLVIESRQRWYAESARFVRPASLG